jgi:hypothetical protein
MPINPRPGVVAVVASLLAVVGFLAFSMYPPSGPAANISITGSGSLVSAVSAQIITPANPGGPTVKVTIYAASQGVPITHVSAILELPATTFFPNGRNVTFEFPNITQANPLLPGSIVSQTYTIIQGGFNSDIRYPIAISGALMDGKKFSLVAYVNVT